MNKPLALFETLATTTPRIEVFLDAATDVLRRHPALPRAVVPALMQGHDAASLRPLAETYIGC